MFVTAPVLCYRAQKSRQLSLASWCDNPHYPLLKPHPPLWHTHTHTHRTHTHSQPSGQWEVTVLCAGSSSGAWRRVGDTQSETSCVCMRTYACDCVCVHVLKQRKRWRGNGGWVWGTRGFWRVRGVLRRRRRLTWHGGCWARSRRGCRDRWWRFHACQPAVTAVVARVPVSLLDQSNSAFHLSHRSEVDAGNGIT